MKKLFLSLFALAIQTYIEDGICELLLDENLAPGDTILVDKAENSEKLTIEQKK